MPDPVISIRGLTKRYGSVTAVKHLDLEVHAGEVVGFLGLNGAGKTTTIRVLLDFLRPTGGSAWIFGHDCQSAGLAARADVGYLPGEMGLYPELTGRETLTLLGGLGTRPVDPRMQKELQDRLELSDGDMRRRLREYSTGMKRKLGLIQAFQTDPLLLILDEPTEGLDPLMQESFYQLVNDTRQRGRTVFMSSHVLSEVERVCDRVALMRKGELALFSTMDEIRNLAPRRVRIVFEQDVPPPTLPSGCETRLIEPRAWELSVSGRLGAVLKLIDGLPVQDLQASETRLEDVLVRYYREGAA